MARFSLTVVAILLASWSMLALIQKSFDYTFGITFTEILAHYNKYTEFIIWIIEPVIHPILDAIGRIFGWSLELHPYWRHILILLFLYMSNYVANNVVARPRNAITLVFFMVPLAILGAVGFGALLTNGVFPALSFPIIALITFAVAASACTSIFYPQEGQTRWRTFHYYWGRTVMPFIVFGFITLLTALIADLTLSREVIEPLALTFLAGFVLALAINLLIRGPEGKQPDNSRRRLFYWFSGSFGPRLGVRIFVVYALAVGQLILDHYGLQSIGL